MDINSEDKMYNITQYQEAILKYAENKYCAKHQPVPGNILESLLSNSLVTVTSPSGCCQRSIEPYDLASNDEEFLTPNNVPGMTHGQCDRAVPVLTPPGSICICRLNNHGPGGNFIQNAIIPTSSQLRFAVYF